MPALDDLLRSVRLPALCLFKDAVLEPYVLPQCPVESCDWMKTGKSLSQLRKLIPQPVMPTDPAKLALLSRHRGEEGTIYFEDGKWVEEPDPPRFDDFIDHFLSGASDREIFGASYTILVVTPPDVEITVGYLAKLMVARRGKRTGLSLFRAWNDYVERMCFYPGAEDCDELRLAILDALEGRLKELPNGWSQEDFELMEYLFGK